MYRIIEITEEDGKTKYRIQKFIGIGKIGFWKNLCGVVGPILALKEDYIEFYSAEEAEEWLSGHLKPRTQKEKIVKVFKESVQRKLTKGGNMGILEWGEEYTHCIGRTNSVKELARIHELTPIEELEDGEKIIEDISKSIIIRKNLQYISHATTLSNGNILVLVPTTWWSDGDGGPLYIFDHHVLYMKDCKNNTWDKVDAFCAEEFESEFFKKERLQHENA